MTVCGPGTHHDRHQNGFLRPRFSHYHYTHFACVILCHVLLASTD